MTKTLITDDKYFELISSILSKKGEYEVIKPEKHELDIIIQDIGLKNINVLTIPSFIINEKQEIWKGKGKRRKSIPKYHF